MLHIESVGLHELRPLDAIHFAAAVSIPDLLAPCTYDERMESAAIQVGLHTVSSEAPD